MNEKRVAILGVPCDVLVFDLLGGGAAVRAINVVYKDKLVPRGDWKVLSCHANYEYRSVDFLICSKHFDEAAPGSLLERLQYTLSYQPPADEPSIVDQTPAPR